jgi:hypothetical protein
MHRIPVTFVDRLRILQQEEYAVFGYLADILYAITNKTGKPIDILLVLDNDDQRPLTLDTNQCYIIDMDVGPCIKRRFMPFVKTYETIQLDVEWRHRGG